MKNDLRTVFDTSVLVSAVLLPRSLPRRAFDLAGQLGKLLLSEATLDELDQVLRRRKFDKYISERDRLEFLVAMVNQAEVVPITLQVAECRDPLDNKFLELALSGHAGQIVTGDADLLVLHPFRGVDVLSPAESLEKFQ